LQKCGYHQHVISLHPLGAGGKILREIGITAVGFPYRGKFGLLTHNLVRNESRQFPADLVMVIGPSVSSALAARSLQDVPKVLNVHYYHGASIRDRIRWAVFYTMFARDYYAIMFNTDFIRREAERIYPPVKEKAIVNPVPIHIPPLPTLEQTKAARINLRLPLDALVIGNAGWLIYKKRFDVLLQVAAALKQDFPKLHVVVAGGGELESSLKGLAVQLGLRERVHWLGWQMDLSNFYRALDLLVFNSEADALGRTPLEAMAYGVPVVASVRYGGLSETLKHGDNGFLIPKHDIEQLKTLCTRLLLDKEYARAIGLKGRETVEGKHNVEHYVQTYIEFFQKAMELYKSGLSIGERLDRDRI